MRRVPALAALLAAFAGGCGGCGGDRGGPPPERFLPADAALAIVVPDAGRAARELAALHATALTFPRTAELGEARAALVAQLGFDPLDPDALGGAGIERRRGAGAAIVAARAGSGAVPHALLVLPVSDAERLDALLARLARERLGAEVRDVETLGAAQVTVVRRAAGAPPALAWTLVQRTALVAAGPDGPALVAGAAALEPARALAASPAFVAARRALGDRLAALAFVPPGAPALEGTPPLREGAAVAFTASEGRLTVRAAIVTRERVGALRGLAGGGAAAPAALRLAPASALVLRWDGEPAPLGRQLLPFAPSRDRAWLAARGFEVERDLLPALAPGAAAAISLAPGAAVAGLTADAFRTDPLSLLAFEAVLPVRDAAVAEKAAAKLERALTRSALAAGRDRDRDPDPDRVHRIPTPSGEVAWTVERDPPRIVAVGGPPGRLEALRARLADDGAGDGFAPPTEAARAALSGGLGGAALDVPRLVASVRALPADAFGTGPSGFVLRSVVSRFVEPAERLLAVSARANVAEEALVIELEAEARPRAGGR